MGVNCHHSVRSVSIDAIVDARMGADKGGAKGLKGAERDRMRLAILDEAAIVCRWGQAPRLPPEGTGPCTPAA